MGLELLVEEVDEAGDGGDAHRAEVVAVGMVLNPGLREEASELLRGIEGLDVVCQADAIEDLASEGGIRDFSVFGSVALGKGLTVVRCVFHRLCWLCNMCISRQNELADGMTFVNKRTAVHTQGHAVSRSVAK